MGKQLSALRSSIRDVMIKSNEITNNIRSAESMASNSLVDVDRAKEAIRRAESSLQAAEQYIDTQGREALQKAEDALRQHGVQSKQMTEIANEAKMEAERWVAYCRSFPAVNRVLQVTVVYWDIIIIISNTLIYDISDLKIGLYMFEY